LLGTRHKAMGGHLEMVKLLIDEHHLDPHAVNKQGFTLLHKAAFSRSMELLRHLVEERSLNVNAVVQGPQYCDLSGVSIGPLLAPRGQMKLSEVVFRDKSVLDVWTMLVADPIPLEYLKSKGAVSARPEWSPAKKRAMIWAFAILAVWFIICIILGAYF
jgi:ankyrin repeat protein